MTSAQKAKGTRWETAVTRFLRDQGVAAFKPRQEGWQDVGDIHAGGLFALQAKDWTDIVSALREGSAGAQVQKRHAGLPFGAAVVKRARKPVGDAYLVFRLADLPDLIAAIRGEQS